VPPVTSTVQLLMARGYCETRPGRDRHGRHEPVEEHRRAERVSLTIASGIYCFDGLAFTPENVMATPSRPK
jgi:hypothetical protein